MRRAGPSRRRVRAPARCPATIAPPVPAHSRSSDDLPPTGRTRAATESNASICAPNSADVVAADCRRSSAGPVGRSIRNADSFQGRELGTRNGERQARPSRCDSIYQQAPGTFHSAKLRQTDRADRVAVRQSARTIRQLSGSLRSGTEEDVPQVETPFLQGHAGGQRTFRHSSAGDRRLPRPLRACRDANRVPIDLPAPDAAANRRADSPSAGRAGSRLRRARRFVFRCPTNRRRRRSAGCTCTLLPVAPSAAPKISPNGTGVPVTERVPASSGSPVPISFPFALGPGAGIPCGEPRPPPPARIPLQGQLRRRAISAAAGAASAARPQSLNVFRRRPADQDLPAAQVDPAASRRFS